MTENNVVYKNNNWPYIVIIILLIVIAILAFFVWASYKWWLWWILPNNSNNTTSTNTTTEVDKNIELKVISDKRCTTCNTQDTITQIKTLPFMATAKIEEIDFADEWAQDLLKANWITKLPAYLFNTNNVSDAQFKWFLQETTWWLYSLNVGANYDPFVKRSDRWFMLLDQELLKSIKDNSNLTWNKDAEISWIEYSDLDCTFCKKLHNAWTHKTLFDKYWDSLNFYYQYYAIFNKTWPEVLECIWDQIWKEKVYDIIKKSYETEKADKASLVEFAWKWVDEKKLDECLAKWEYKAKVEDHMKVWSQTFWITWTPWNILINNKTWEYEILPWAYPTADFEKLIDRLLVK